MLEISSEAAAHLKARLDDVLPILRDQNVGNDAIQDILIDLYKAGVNDGSAKANGLLQQITKDMTHIVMAYLSRDAEKLAAAVGAFVERRVIVNAVGDTANRTRH